MITVLVVDDDFRVARIHSAFVDRVEGFRTIGVANTGQEALRLAVALVPDLILLDLYLPDVFGLDVLNRMRVAGVEGDEQITDSQAGVEVAGIPDAEAFLAATAGFIAAANARTSVLWIEFLSAATSDEEVADALAGLLERRRQDYRAVAGMLIGRGMVRDGTDLDTAAAVLSFLWSPESHQQLVLQGGWSERRYEEWLVEAARRQLG